MNVDLDTVSSIATALGVTIAVWQLRESRKLREAEFEDGFDRQYRDLSFTIPVSALLGDELKESEVTKAREAIYNYLDLCNEQVYQRHKKRISPDRWCEWNSGIKYNLGRPVFKEIWAEVKSKNPGGFSYLERLEKSGFMVDPAEFPKS